MENLVFRLETMSEGRSWLDVENDEMADQVCFKKLNRITYITPSWATTCFCAGSLAQL